MSCATLTFARSESEEKLIFDSLQILSKKVSCLVVVDGGSEIKFLRKIKKIPNIKLIINHGTFIEQVKASLKEAVRRSNVVLYTESDKKYFFSNSLEQFLTRSEPYLLDDNFGIILPSRDKQSFLSFPKFQQQTEKFLNSTISHFLKKKLDYTYGPRIISRELVSYLDDVNKDITWGWMTYVLLKAYKNNKTIHGVELYLPDINNQKEDSMNKIYRISQLEAHLEAFKMAQSYL